MEVDGVQVRVKAAVADNLPVSVLLGTDIPQLGKLLQINPSTIHTDGVEMVVRTCAQVRNEELERSQEAIDETSSDV